MLLHLHLSPERLRERREILRQDPAFTELRARLRRVLAGPTVLDHTLPGLVNSADVCAYDIGHLGGALAICHMLEPLPEAERRLLNLLRWIPAQTSLMWGQNISLGQFLKGVILALDAVGEQLSGTERAAVLDHLTAFCIENPDPTHIANCHPTGAQPMRRYLEIPGTGFHIKDEQVNNWDSVCGLGLLYMARAVAALQPERAATAQAWRDIAVVRLQRFLRRAYSHEGECGEGPSYYSYGTTPCVLMLDCLEHWPGQPATVTPDELTGLLNSPRWSREMYHARLEDGRFNLNDSMTAGYESPGVVHWIAARAHDPQAQGYGDDLRRLHLGLEDGDVQASEHLVQSFLWRDPSLAARRTTGRRAFAFGRLGTVICRQGDAAQDAHFLLQAGEHAGAHTHAARGNLLLWAHGEYLLCDAGMPADRSIPAYFPWHRLTGAHNCVQIGRQSQVWENERGHVRGRITRLDTQAAGVLISADCTEVWPDARRVERHLFFSWQGWVLVCDRVEVAKGPVELLFHTDNRDRQATILLQRDAVVLGRPRASLWILFGSGLGQALDEGAHYLESDPQGMRSVRIACTAPESVCLLLPRCPAHSVPAPASVLTRDADGAWRVTVDGAVTPVCFPT